MIMAAKKILIRTEQTSSIERHHEHSPAIPLAKAMKEIKIPTSISNVQAHHETILTQAAFLTEV